MDAPIDPRRNPIREKKPVPAEVVDSRQSFAKAGDTRIESENKAYYDTQGNLVQRQEEFMDNPNARRWNGLERVTQVIYFLLGLLEILLALRFFFRLFGASRGNTLVDVIYNITGPLVAPFNGIFNDQALDRSNLLEVSTLLAMLIYALVGWGIVKLLHLVLKPAPTSEETYAASTRRRLH